ncbi:hypothetical protein FQR65_LT02165 [Abscondita terminalis]|nr:hypothetical protein FQR65_LT02165 [Abscondita terminalis]
MQTPPNKPVSIIAPFMQGNTRYQPKCLNPIVKTPCNIKTYPRPVQRHKSFHGFGTQIPNSVTLPQSNEFCKMHLTVARDFPINRFSSVTEIPFQKPRVAGRREQLRNDSEKIGNPNVVNTLTIGNASEKRFGSLELKKHKCYSPTFYSVRCKKHSKKRSVIYAIPKKCKSDSTTKTVAENSNSESDMFVFKSDKANTFEDLTNSIQIMEQNNENNVKQNLLTAPKPAPRCKRHRKNSCHVYENVSALKSEAENLDSSNNSSVNGVEISFTEALVHNSTADNDVETNTNSNLKRSPTVKVSPSVIKTVYPKDAQLHLKNSERSSPNADEKFLIPEMPLLDTQNKWTPTLSNTNQNAFYTLTTPHFKHVPSPQLSQQYAATIPHQKHMKLIPRALFHDQQISKSKSFSSRSKQKKHFQIPLQKCHSFKFQTAESYFQPIKNVHEENLMRNGYVSDFGPGYNDRGHGRTHKKDKYKNKGPLVLKRPSDYQENANDLHNMVQLQYPQPMYCKKKEAGGNRPNGIVYADLDIPKSSTSSSSSSNKQSAQQTNSPLTKLPKSKPKTEYATLNFNEVGKEIDV